MPANFVAAVEGFDIYPNGTLPANYPWFITDSTKAAQINLTAGAFGGAALTFPTTGAGSTLSSGTEYQFPSTMRMIRGTTNGNMGVFSVNMWLNINTMTTGSGTLLSMGTAGIPGSIMPLLNVSQSSSAGVNLQFVTNVNSPTSSPFNFNVQLNTYYWIQLQYAYYSTGAAATTGVLLGSFSVNGTSFLTDQPITWSADVFAAGQVMNRMKFGASNFISYFIDDMVIQAVSNSDANWPLGAGVNPTPESIPAMSARRVFVGTATANGSLTQLTPSGSEPNWQSATDPTGDNFVTATAAGQTDTYKWTAPALSDVRAVVVKGNSNRYSNLQGSFKTSSGGSLVQMNTNFGPSRYVSISENDGANAWTQTSIEAGEFGETSR
jgi:hypothetical protein